MKQFGLWGHVCAATWTNDEASAVCKTLGHFAGVVSWGSSYGTRLPTWVDDMDCPAGASDVSDCQVTMMNYSIPDGQDYTSCNGRHAVCYEEGDGKRLEVYVWYM